MLCSAETELRWVILKLWAALIKRLLVSKEAPLRDYANSFPSLESIMRLFHVAFNCIFGAVVPRAVVVLSLSCLVLNVLCDCFLCIQNNIAEVEELHGELMVQSFLDHIRSLLHSSEVEVSYFAAGILAHLTSRGEKVWTLELSLRTTLLEQLVRVCANTSINCLGIIALRPE